MEAHAVGGDLGELPLSLCYDLSLHAERRNFALGLTALSMCCDPLPRPHSAINLSPAVSVNTAQPTATAGCRRRQGSSGSSSFSFP